MKKKQQLEITTLKNGLKILFYKTNNFATNISIIANTIESNYPNTKPGTAHFLEHLILEASEKYPNEEAIEFAIHKYGGNINAATSNKFTMFTVNILNKHFKKGLDVLANCIQKPLLLDKDIKKERKVILNVQTKLGYMDQELKDLTNYATLYDEIYALTKDVAKTRQQLSIGGFVTEEEVYKPIKLLSLGEKSRLNLIKILIKKPNLLLLDEPTNHLDIDAREIIEEAFMNYQGAILAVSHDRYFIKKIAQRIIKIENKKLFEIKR